MRTLIVGLFVLLVVAGCHKDVEVPVPEEVDMPYVIELPPGAPPIPMPAGAVLTQASVSLGKALFFDTRLSLGKGVACASCHHPDNAFSDTVALSVGAHGATGFRNAPSLANCAYLPSYFRDGGVPSLELQVLAPVTDPVEMDADMNAVVQQLRDDPVYRAQSLNAYGEELSTFVITRAVAAYERTLISGSSRFDRFMYQGDQGALTQQEQNGWIIFNGPEAHCNACHSGFDLSDHSFQNIGTSIDHTTDPGRERITLLPSDRGKFKVPTLRNIARTAPYMHDGSMTTLDQVIDHFASGGVEDPNKSPLVTSFSLTQQQKEDLISFLESLTDERSLDQVP